MVARPKPLKKADSLAEEFVVDDPFVRKYFSSGESFWGEGGEDGQIVDKNVDIVDFWADDNERAGGLAGHGSRGGARRLSPRLRPTWRRHRAAARPSIGRNRLGLPISTEDQLASRKQPK